MTEVFKSDVHALISAVKRSSDRSKETVEMSFGGRQGGKSHRAAINAAALIKEGKTVLAASIVDGRPILERIVSVPGYDDGTQIRDKSK